MTSKEYFSQSKHHRRQWRKTKSCAVWSIKLFWFWGYVQRLKEKYKTMDFVLTWRYMVCTGLYWPVLEPWLCSPSNIHYACILSNSTSPEMPNSSSSVQQTLCFMLLVHSHPERYTLLNIPESNCTFALHVTRKSKQCNCLLSQKPMQIYSKKEKDNSIYEDLSPFSTHSLLEIVSSLIWHGTLELTICFREPSDEQKTGHFL